MPVFRKLYSRFIHLFSDVKVFVLLLIFAGISGRDIDEFGAVWSHTAPFPYWPYKTIDYPALMLKWKPYAIDHESSGYLSGQTIFVWKRNCRIWI